MALTITDDRTIISDCDATTGWSSGSLNTSDPDPVELSGCLALQASTATVRSYFTATAINFTAGNSPGPSLIYEWFTHRAALDTRANGGVGMYIGDGTNDIVFHMAGKDIAVFRHDSGPSLWQCLVLDTASLPTSYTVVSGSYASLNWAAITRIGIQFKTLAKSIGGSVNVFWDILRRGAIGVGFTMTGATSGTPGTFSEIATADATTTSGYGYGLSRQVEAGVYGVQGPLTFGSTTAGVDCYLTDSDKTLVFESRGMGNDKYVLKVLGNASSGVTNFSLTDCIIKSAGPYVTCNFSSTGIDTLTLNRCTFSSLGNAISFSTASGDTANHNVTSCKFDVCGQIDPGLVTFTGSTIARSTAAATGALLIDADGTANMSGLTFVSGGSGHAIYITAAGSYTLTNFSYSGYGADGTSNASVYNNSGGEVNLTISGGSTPTVLNGSGSTTNIITSPVTFSVTTKTTTGSLLSSVRVFVKAADGTGPMPYQESVTITRSGTTATVSHTGHGMASNDKVLIAGVTGPTEADALLYNGVFTITKTGADSYTYTMSDTPSGNATGTIVATYVALWGDTSAGIITDTRAFSGNQPVVGWARKSTEAPYYKEGSISDTISSSTGMANTAVLSSDQ